MPESVVFPPCYTTRQQKSSQLLGRVITLFVEPLIIARAVDAGLLPSRVEQLLGRHITTDTN